MVNDPWLEAGTIASILVAAFTGWLAWSTRNLATETKLLAGETAKLARDTVSATLAAERHHQEQMRPLLLIDASLTVKDKVSKDSGFSYVLSLEGDICNFGGGPATAVQLVVTPVGQIDENIPLALIGPNTRHSLKSVTWTTWSTAQRDSGDAWPFSTVLGYSTVGFTLNVGTTKQRSHSGTARDLRVEFIKPTDSVELHG